MKARFLIPVVVILIFGSCISKTEEIQVLVKNTLEITRENETVELLKTELGIVDDSKFMSLGIVNVKTNKELISQHIDKDADGIMDAIIFQPKVAAGSTEAFNVIPTQNVDSVPSKVFSRFVPERTDDYAWENDKVAFRTYGPMAQKLNEEGDPAGTLSSGMDCWLKKVDYSIIDKWYEKHTSGAGSYHEDTGEGFDPYHVGTSRGCGGIGVWADSQLFVSKNFADYSTLSNGPIRTSFTLDYEDWKAGDRRVKEQKHVSLDLGNNLMHIVAKIVGVDEITIGLTLHEKDGVISMDTLNYCFSYWEPMKDSELGTGIVIEPKYYLGVTKVISDEKDKSQLLVHLKVIDGIVAYYSGFGWKESGQFQTADEWQSYLLIMSEKIQSPLNLHNTGINY
ncbi:MAG: DUF4861 family protein [Salinivirgaceae bacterium]|jgi:hypothetical protein|nr:DUF4861 family protein [Salinivirgaceae bacterium]